MGKVSKEHKNEIIEDKQCVKKCKKCKAIFQYMPEDTQWINHASYSAKVVTCTECGCVNVIKYTDASGLYVNIDGRYY